MATAIVSPPASAQDEAAALLGELAQAPDASVAERLERQIVNAWSKSGSPAMDVLLSRGRAALAVEDWAQAAAHFRALTDHAPEFAEGWHGLAIAYYNAERFGPAMAALERTLTLNPDHFGALRGVGAIHEQVNNPELAYEAYARVRDIRPHDDGIEEALSRLERAVIGSAL
jgi:tetratricopeptide (TPR) repeat protein